MDNRTKSRLLGAVIIAVLTGLLLPSLFGGRSDLWGRWIFDFQTLITGFLALGAAYFTIYQMQKSDQRLEKRHQDQLELQLRPYKLKAERLCGSGCLFLKADISRLKQTFDPKQLQARAEYQPRLHLRLTAKSLHSVVSRVISELKRSVWVEALEIFDHEQRAFYDMTLRQAEMTEEMLARFVNKLEQQFAESRNTLTPPQFVELENMTYAIRDFLQDLIDFGDSAIASLDALAATYQVKDRLSETAERSEFKKKN